jgi:photosystem II stability/assembly factor-like uncharacterized protein
MKTFITSTLIVISIIAGLNHATAQWSQLKIYDDKGVIKDVVIQGNTILAATKGAGIFRSPDKGVTWAPINTGIANASNGGVPDANAFLATSADILVGTGTGVYRTINQGSSWTKCNTGIKYPDVSSLYMDGANLYAGTYHYVYKSTDHAVTWTEYVQGLPTYNYKTSIVVVGSTIFTAAYNDGVYRSIDNGSTWVLTSEGLPSYPDITSLAAIGNSLFAATYAGVFSSTNNGDQWVQGSLTASTGFLKLINGTLYAGTTDGLFKSVDNGNTWISMSGNLSTDFEVISLAYDNNTFVAGTRGGGLFLSNDNGVSWSPINKGLHAMITPLSVTTDGKTITVGTDGIGTYSTSNNGISWTNHYLPNESIEQLCSANNSVFVGTENGMFRLIEDGSNWTSLDQGFSEVPPWIWTVVADGTNLWAGSEDVYCSTDNGNFWRPMGKGLPSGYKGILKIATGKNAMIIGADVGYDFQSIIYRSTDQGNNWEQSTLKLGTTDGIRALACLDETFFAAVSAKLYSSTDGGMNWTETGLNTYVNSMAVYEGTIFAPTMFNGIYLSTDKGKSWNTINTGLTNLNVPSILVCGKYLVALTEGTGIWIRPLSDIIPSSGTISMEPSSQNVTASAGTLIPVTVTIGSSKPIVAPDDISGVSFKLTWDNTDYLAYASNTAGSFWGTTPLSLVQSFTDHIEAVVSGTGRGSIGTGTVITCSLKVMKAPTSAIRITLKLTDIVATRSNGTTLYLTSLPDPTITLTPTVSVWPGDANNDGLVSASDILPLGLYYGKTGGARADKSGMWAATAAVPWTSDAKATFADGDGNGVINASDVISIGINYGKTHAAASAILPKQDVGKKQAGGNERMLQVRIYDLNNQLIPLSAIKNGSEYYLAIEVNDAHGIVGASFDLTWKRPAQNSSSITIVDGWETNGMKLADVWGSTSIQIAKSDETEGLISIGASRTDAAAIEGKDVELVRVRMKIVDNGNIAFSFKNIHANDEAGHDIDISGSASAAGSLETTSGVPTEFQVANYPNPFNPVTRIQVSIPSESMVSLAIYNSLGQEVSRILEHEKLQSGVYEYNWNASNQPSGVYLCRLQTNHAVAIKKLMLLK